MPRLGRSRLLREYERRRATKEVPNRTIIAALQFFVNMEDPPTRRIISIMSHMFHLDFMSDGFGKRIVVGTGVPKSG